MNTNYKEIPEFAMETMNNYIENGWHPGQFFEAVFSNNLFKAFAFSDEESQENLFLYVKYIYNKAPTGCHGSVKKFNAWIKDGGKQ
tara:strand:+ start:387 stop:644 length:258 start_codon:yes stop_codon:yes gene_type:complete